MLALLDELVLALVLAVVIKWAILPEAILWVIIPVMFLGLHLGLNKFLRAHAGNDLFAALKSQISRKDISLVVAWVGALLVHGFIGLSMWLATPLLWLIVYFAFKEKR